MNNSDIQYGRFESAVVRGPAVEVDCSNWDALGETIVYGSFENDAVRGPAIEVDCKGWGQVVQVQLTVQEGVSEETLRKRQSKRQDDGIDAE
jgi:hypothetical protein